MKSKLLKDIEKIEMLQLILAKFLPDTIIDEAYVVNSGHINDTYRIHVASLNPNKPDMYVMQRINTTVFTEPEKLMENMVRVTSHIKNKLHEAGHPIERRVLNVYQLMDGGSCYIDEKKQAWRLVDFVAETHSHDLAQGTKHAYEAAYAFGEFQSQLHDLEGPDLHTTIPDYHNTPVRFGHLEQAIEADCVNRRSTCQPEIEFALARKEMTSILTDYIASGKMQNKPTHNDTKINNVLIDICSGRGICVIDLDTVMSGLPLYDFGDCVRSTTMTGPEDSTDLDKISMDIDLFKAITRGFLDSVGDYLTDLEIESLPIAAKIITFEIGIRFLTDYLNNDIYFKVSHPEHNLERARVHFKMIESMEEQMDEMQRIVAKLSKTTQQA